MSVAHAYPPNLQDPLIQPQPPHTTSSRRTVIRSSSKSISGSYPLYDLLSISTTSGSISVDVNPHSASSKDPSQPATLELRSTSGSVDVTLSEAFMEYDASSPVFNADDDILTSTYTDPKDAPKHHPKDRSGSAIQQCGYPEREYITSVSSRSGSISGVLPLGTRTKLDSRSGSLNNIELVVMPANVSASRELSTVSRDGSQSVRIVEECSWTEEKDEWWEGMLSKHESKSGSIDVEYPDTWEGTIDVETKSGSVSVTGRGVKIIREVNGRTIATKGNEDGGKVIARAESGSVDLRFG